MDLACFEPTAATGTTSTRIWTNSQNPLIASYTSLKCTKLFLSLSLSHVFTLQLHHSRLIWVGKMTLSKVGAGLSGAPRLGSQQMCLLLSLLSFGSFFFLEPSGDFPHRHDRHDVLWCVVIVAIARQWWSTSFDTRNNSLDWCTWLTLIKSYSIL